MLVYEPKNLREQIRELRHLQDFSVIPILDRIVERFVKDLYEDSSKYNASAIRAIQTSENNVSFNVIIGKEILTLTIYRTNINSINEDPNWWMRFKIKLNGKEELCSRFIGLFKEFVGQQNFRELKDEATSVLTKGKTYNLNNEMYNFYLDI